MNKDELRQIRSMLEVLLLKDDLIQWVGGYAYGYTETNDDPFIILYPAGDVLENRWCRVYPQHFKKLPPFIDTENFPQNVSVSKSDPKKSAAIKMGLFHECPPFKILMHLGKETNLGFEKRFYDVLYYKKGQAITPAGNGERQAQPQQATTKPKRKPERAQPKRKPTNQPPPPPEPPFEELFPANETPAGVGDQQNTQPGFQFKDQGFAANLAKCHAAKTASEFDAAIAELKPFFMNGETAKTFREAVIGKHFNPSYIRHYTEWMIAYATQREDGTAHRAAKESIDKKKDLTGYIEIEKE